VTQCCLIPDSVFSFYILLIVLMNLKVFNRFLKISGPKLNKGWDFL